MHDELQPYLVYRIAGAQLECALWQVQDGAKALALFLSEASATAYRNTCLTGDEWKVLRPRRDDLWQILKECHANGVPFAVLDPDQEKAVRVFDIKEILTTVVGE